MTAPRSTPAAHVTISNKTVPVLLGSFSGQIQIINNSASDIVWIGDSTALSAATGIPVQAQSALQYGSSQNYNVYAILDPNASAPVDLIIGGDASLWSPSPVKVVNISGPVTVSGTVSISGTVSVAGSVSISSGTVNVGTITGTVTITGPVTVTNTPSVIPINTLSLVVNNFTTVSGGGFTGIPTTGFNSLIVQCQLQHTAGSPGLNAFGSFTITLYNGSNTLFKYTYYQQAVYSTNGSQLDDLTLTVIPLRGATSFDCSFTSPTGANPGSQSMSVWATTADYDPSHRSYQQINGPVLYDSAGNLAVPTGTTTTIPIPITNNPVTIYMFSSGTGTGTVSTTLTLTDSIHTATRPYAVTGVPKSPAAGSNPVIQLPNSLMPMTLNINETGSGTTAQYEVLMLEGALPVAA